MSRVTLALVFVVVALAGCATREAPRSLRRGDLQRGCALGVPRGRVSAEDTANGIALDFVSTERPEEMRVRANDAAAQHGPNQQLGQGHDGTHGEGRKHGLRLAQAPAASSVASDIEGGARIVFVPANAADRDVLRTKLRERADRMNASACP